jgi:hypothetical protein
MTAIACDSSRCADAEAAIRSLLQPYLVEEFLARHWEREYLHVSRKDDNLAASLVSVKDVDEILTTFYSSGTHRWDAVRVAHDGFLVSPAEFLRNREGPVAEVDVERIAQMYQGGSSIILNRVHEVLPQVFRFCSALSDFFGVNVHANAYINPPASQSLPLHFDVHDVFMLQAVGEKAWNLYPSPVRLATAAVQGDNCPEPIGPGRRVRLQAGEVVYLPRGMLHEGVTEDRMSLHLSIGVNQYTWAELLADVLAELEQDDEDFRRSVAAGPVESEVVDDDFVSTLGALASRIADARRVRDVARRHSEHVRRRNARPRPGMFEAVADPARILSTTLVVIRPGCEVLVERREHDILIRFDDKALAVPAYVEPQVRCLFAGTTVSAETLPSDLDAAGRLVLIRRLVREGLLIVKG